MDPRNNSNEQALLNVFGATLINEPKALRECLNLLRIYRIEPETLHSKWEAFIMNRTSSAADAADDGTTMSTVNLEGFKAHLRRTLEQQALQHQNQQHQASHMTSGAYAMPKKAAIKNRYHGGGSAGSSSRVNHDMDLDPYNEFSSPSSKLFALRKNVNEIEETLNGHLPQRSHPSTAGNGSSEYQHSINLVVPVKPYRYMFEKLSEKGEALDEKIDMFASLYKESYPETEFQNPSQPSQNVITVIGRICSDANEGKSNEHSLVLETSRRLGGGARIRLDVTELSSLNFFPGQIAVLDGINVNGSTFVATKIHKLPVQSMAGASPAELEELQYRRLGGQPIKMVVAAGPYTLSDNLLFEPLEALMEHVNKERPDILLLMGPFISSQHPHILSGDVDMLPEAYFSKYISSRLAQHQERYPREMQILLVPSQQDIIHETTVLPQPEFEHQRALELPTGTYCLPNPAQFTINEMVFAVNTSDILLQLSGDEVTVNPERTDRLGRLSKYLVEQRSLHPVYPGLVSDIEAGIDFNQLDLLDLKVCPDILLLPSKLKHFAKTVDNVMMVNPNQLSKAQTGGTFAVLTIHPMAQDYLSDAVMIMDDEDERTMSMYHRVYERCRVDIVRV
ncbi:DNA-directed DNA polymerase alpha subunit pol12 [Lunasporangiospora selenospora]|uniref:DNA polymerase alpha subunit B n=1 Tax=Lunasporangiospora selenospora TaxID=979761 RepID=A0A9P6KHN2_9FUNG|nr:DNA-directed DNA polymerase alpha subunit pol12 [Lunasporangiospora selenospora]